MGSYQIIKEQREAAGLTIQEFCEKAGISTGAFVEYQNGTKSLLCIPLGKAVRMFSLIGIDIEKFYDGHFPGLRQETAQKLEEWRLGHPAELDFGKLKSRYRMRIAKMKERKFLSGMEADGLLCDYNGIFKELERHVDINGMIPEQVYREMVLPLSYGLKQKQEGNKIRNAVSALLHEAILKSGMTYADLGEIAGVTPRRLTACKTSPEGYSSMKISSVLKICHALNVPFDDIRARC